MILQNNPSSVYGAAQGGTASINPSSVYGAAQGGTASINPSPVYGGGQGGTASINPSPVYGGGQGGGSALAAGAPRSGIAKRVFDLGLGSLCLVLLSPLLAIVALLVRLTTPGPALFRQVRIGRDARRFTLYKFRTMYDGSPSDVHRDYVHKLLTDDQPPAGGRRGLYKLEDDPRVTPIGRLLRRTSIDELPQLINVIRGEMSLVGPRPVLPWEAELIMRSHAQRFSVAPGLTGLWQVSGRSSLTMRQALDLDVAYVERQSFLLDFGILLKTLPVVLSTDGAQ
jgi:lipopolysaccharide/colanic/teichoic acid biosynthesis glycosyltransferase